MVFNECLAGILILLELCFETLLVSDRRQMHIILVVAVLFLLIFDWLDKDVVLVENFLVLS